MPDAAYYRAWRAAHPIYRERERIRATTRVRGDRTQERLREKERRKPRAIEPLRPLMEHLQHGTMVSFWEDELRLDLAQERALAILENIDPDAAVRAYRAREMGWRQHTCPFNLDGDNDP